MLHKIITIISLLLAATTLTLADMDHSKMDHNTMMDSTSHVQTTCPVMKGTQINKDQYVDVDGKRIYLCCGMCKATIKKDPQKYIAELKAAGVVLEETPK